MCQKNAHSIRNIASNKWEEFVLSIFDVSYVLFDNKCRSLIWQITRSSIKCYVWAMCSLIVLWFKSLNITNIGRIRVNKKFWISIVNFMQGSFVNIFSITLCTLMCLLLFFRTTAKIWKQEILIMWQNLIKLKVLVTVFFSNTMHTCAAEKMKYVNYFSYTWNPFYIYLIIL